MNEVEPVLHAGYAFWLALALGLFALFQAIRYGRRAWMRFKFRDHEFTDPAMQRMVDALPPRRDWLWSLLFALVAGAMLLGAADLRGAFL